jgi:hypothetical protein
MIEALKKQILEVNQSNFDAVALSIFRYQAVNCEPYSQYIKHLNLAIESVNEVEKIPFLPISFFKSQKVIVNNLLPETIFQSSGTTGLNTSQHFVADLNFYKKISQNIFEKAYGSLQNYHIIAMLPSYLERGNSSLVYMIKHFIEQSKSVHSAFYTADYEAIMAVFDQLKAEPEQSKKILLWGVTFAVLELAEIGYDFSSFKNRLILLETGGMKGRKKELIREELYEKLKIGYCLQEIHSEYGMTELLSQAYSANDALFQCSASMKIFLRELNDPFTILPKSKTKKSGGINIIDLANVASCSFIETQDLGQYGETENTFKVLGRFDNSDLRGCNLLF